MYRATEFLALDLAAVYTTEIIVARKHSQVVIKFNECNSPNYMHYIQK